MYDGGYGTGGCPVAIAACEQWEEEGRREGEWSSCLARKGEAIDHAFFLVVVPYFELILSNPFPALHPCRGLNVVNGGWDLRLN